MTKAPKKDKTLSGGEVLPKENLRQESQDSSENHSMEKPDWLSDLLEQSDETPEKHLTPETNTEETALLPLPSETIEEKNLPVLVEKNTTLPALSKESSLLPIETEIVPDAQNISLAPLEPAPVSATLTPIPIEEELPVLPSLLEEAKTKPVQEKALVPSALPVLQTPDKHDVFEEDQEEALEKENESLPVPRQASLLEKALTGLVMIVLVGGIVWGFARPKNLIAPPSGDVLERVSHAPECRRIRFDLQKMLGERWKSLASSCIRGDCKTLRDELIARNFPVSEWRLIDPETQDEGCDISRGSPLQNAVCTRLIGRIEGSADTLFLQVAGECQERL